MEEIKEDLEARKKRYESSNPAKITALELELSDERSKYEALHERYQTLSEKLERLQVLMDSVKTEIEDPEAGIHVASMNTIVTSLQDLREEYNRLKAVYEKYPDDAAIVLTKTICPNPKCKYEYYYLSYEASSDTITKMKAVRPEDFYQWDSLYQYKDIVNMTVESGKIRTVCPCCGQS